jgi:YVTN family beta-propeller protein
LVRTRNLLFAVLCTLTFSVPAGADNYVLFESGPVRPIALSPDGTRLFVANAPDNRLEIFDVGAAGNLVPAGSVPVGMEPVAVAARSNSEVWVVNHLSDSVSVVDVGSSPKRVVRTLLVGDEPRDIVFAGPSQGRAFITTAHRGQHRTDPSISSVAGAGDPQLTTPGVSRADVWVFDANQLGATLGGTPLKIVQLFGDTPRALAVGNGGNTVYAAVFHSGNQTTTVNETTVCNGFAAAVSCPGDGITSPGGLPGGDLPGGNPGPGVNHQNVAAPEVGLLVKFDPVSSQWTDELGRNWSNGVRFSLPDHDVFAIDANTLNPSGEWDHVGTVLFNMAVHPTNEKIYVSNGESQNMTRFEGSGVFGGSTVQGNLMQYRISVLSGVSTVQVRHLNKHIDYGLLPAPPTTKNHSLATPLDMVFSSDGSKLYVAAFGSSKVGVFDTTSLENDSFQPAVQSSQYISVSGGGPAGLALNSAGTRLYVYTRFRHAISVVDTLGRVELGSVPIRDPEPAHVVEGRSMLYDAFVTSSNGEASCSSCHIFGDLDSLAWDLGDPDGDVTTNTIPFVIGTGADVNGGADNDEFHPMKGPMTTQTLRGLANSGGMHWRGDRVDGFFGLDAPYQNGVGDTGDEALNFDNFIVAFQGLIGGSTPATDPQLQFDMQAFTDFALELTLPPNPVRPLENVLTPSAANGQTIYFNDNTDTLTCNGCHTLQPQNGFFGTGGLASFEGETQILKIPHLRNMYQKVGMFGMPSVAAVLPGDNAHKGDQVRGFGFLHDGSTDSLFRFFRSVVFALAPPAVGFDNDTQRRNMEQFMLQFPSDLAPVVGQQITDHSSATADVSGRIGLLRARAGAAFVSKALGGSVRECDLVVKGVVGGLERGYLWDVAGGNYDSDRASEVNLSQASLDAAADVPGQYLTYTCAPPGSGVRMALDRDTDGAFDRDELDQGTDPANPGSRLNACSDGIDNDGDGFTDSADLACAAGSVHNERPQCNDGVDNDGDNRVDGLDVGCAHAADDVETDPLTACNDGIDNDGDGLIDHVAAGGGDPGCAGPTYTRENPQCQDGIDNDGQPGIDFDGGAFLDRDNDGFIDAAFNPGTPPVGAADPDCAGRPGGSRERGRSCGLGFEIVLIAPLLVRLMTRPRTSGGTPR